MKKLTAIETGTVLAGGPGIVINLHSMKKLTIIEAGTVLAGGPGIVLQ